VQWSSCCVENAEKSAKFRVRDQVPDTDNRSYYTAGALYDANDTTAIITGTHILDILSQRKANTGGIMSPN